ncbi:MAG: hypothetical protein ACPG77_19475, partial [Nannocystaceae bacterium]
MNVLKSRVRQAVELLLCRRQHILQAAWGQHDSADLYAGACLFVLRLITLRVAESRRLRATKSVVPHQSRVGALYNRLREATPIQRGQSNRGWSDLLQLFRDVHTEATGN